MIYRVNKPFLWFKEGTRLKKEEVEEHWIAEGHIDVISEEEKVVKTKSNKSKRGIKDLIEDVLDDGKLNKSNKRGRKKK